MQLRRFQNPDPLLFSLLVVLSLPGKSAPLDAALIPVQPGDDLQDAVDNMLPGDTLELAGGTYTLTSRFSIQLNCTAALPCTLRAKAGEQPVLHRPNAAQNIVDLELSAHVALIGLELSGGSRGLRIRASSFVTVEDCHIHDTADAALAANDPGSSYQGLRLVGNHIHHTDDTGEGMYLGCNFNGCQLFESVIERNYIHHTNGPGVGQGDGIEIKEGSWGNVVRDNVIHDTGYPCILTYSTVGNGGPNLIEGNLLWSCGDHAIQSAADAIIRNNVILGADNNGIALQAHQSGTPSNLVIAHNTVLAPANAAISVSGITGSVVIANNALFAQLGNAIQASGPVAGLVVSGNVGEGGLSGIASGFDSSASLADLVAASYSGTLPQNVFPAPSSRLADAADPTWLAAVDFEHQGRATADAGAYRYLPNGGPIWFLAADFKPDLGIFSDGFESGGTSSWSTTGP